MRSFDKDAITKQLTEMKPFTDDKMFSFYFNQNLNSIKQTIHKLFQNFKTKYYKYTLTKPHTHTTFKLTYKYAKRNRGNVNLSNSNQTVQCVFLSVCVEEPSFINVTHSEFQVLISLAFSPFIFITFRTLILIYFRSISYRLFYTHAKRQQNLAHIKFLFILTKQNYIYFYLIVFFSIFLPSFVQIDHLDL